MKRTTKIIYIIMAVPLIIIFWGIIIRLGFILLLNGRFKLTNDTPKNEKFLIFIYDNYSPPELKKACWFSNSILSFLSFV